MSLALVLLLVVFAVLVLIDTPIAVALGLSSVIYLLIADAAPMIVVAQRAVAGIDSFTLLAIPLFLLAGLLMAQGGLAPRIIALCAAIVGQRTGGMAIVMIIACMLFGSLSGSGVADVVAIGTMMMPAMRERGYDPGFSAAALGCAGSLGTVIPPSIVLIVYGTATNSSVGQLFMGGIVPGILLGIGLMVVAWWQARRHGWSGGEPYDPARLRAAAKDAGLALLAPVIIVGGIRTGIFTPTEAAGIGVAYALIIGLFVYRSLTPSSVFRLLRETAEGTGAILLVIAAASVFGWILAAEQVPQMAVDAISGATESRTVALLLMMLVLIVLGTFMESIAIILILAPVFLPILRQYGIDPVYFGILLTVNLAIGANTPPLGIDLMAACRVADIPLSRALRQLVPFLGVMLAVLILLILVPQLVTGLSSLFS
ncbi:TRAP transporter large permease [Mameliella sediminis]|uniref:TRAP transporter large permease n=1 Tax=Mameliella sediminis TaxID=2836866 RepID=UPI001C443A83|nr:TRAP transporter large permease [Mameliella sediminis]MBY6116824.1 TRAP transporter large permease [Antarctobacter heliothermus]MBY6146577.1 TRAP transporter large permease [Mameliella alba]MBV7396479.1 TRAP transporter large permease [Mameliella sediminis]MBY6162806.1 TRAP transporter large permease [Mameliella alba]MBY6171069.1 TRAP transporter large permease [Mameliella alba]